jgi:geranylgeranyl diphosphate synthase type I
LVGLTLENVPASVSKIFNELLVAGEIEDEQLSFMRQTITDSGALAKTERMIEEHSTRAIEALAGLEVNNQARRMLSQLTEKVINRQS